MSDVINIILAISLMGLLWGYIKKYRDNRDEFTRWELLGTGLSLAGLLCLIAAKMVETFWV